MQMTRRQALKTTTLAGVALAASPRLFAEKTATASVNLPDLPYAFDALEPCIDAMTMEIHHDKHHAGYTRKFNAALEGLDVGGSPAELLAGIPDLPEGVRSSVRNNGGGYVNHDLFWKIMAPPGQGGGGDPAGTLAAALNQTFGSLGAFRDAFSRAAATRFGSGWAWLVVRADNSLAITSTANQDNPLMKGVVDPDQLGTPILGLDVWEHAYYLHYQNRRGDYIANWWKVVNWSEVARRHAEALS